MTEIPSAIQRLTEGNLRYASGTPTSPPGPFPELAAGQQPFACVIGCADSRVPPEVLFDQAPGDLFTIRVAGNVITPAPLASVEFAVHHLGVRDVIVLGHSGCGAVRASLASLDTPAELPPALTELIDLIKPALTPDMDLPSAVAANIHLAIQYLTDAPSLDVSGLRFHPAEYDLASSKVRFL